MTQANAVRPAAGDESAAQRRKRQKLAAGDALTVGGDSSAGIATATAAETVRWMSWNSQRRAFQCAFRLLADAASLSPLQARRCIMTGSRE